MPKSPVVVFLIISFCCFTGLFSVKAQYRISLDSVDKLTFIKQGYILSNEYQKVEVLKEGDIWKSYQTELHTEGLKAINDLKRTFLKDISPTEITNLLDLLSQTDTTIHPDLFNINRKEIIDSISVTYPFLQPKQLAEMKMAINTDSAFNRYLELVIKHPFMADDQTNYIIQIQTKSAKLYTIHAHSYSYSRYYFLPWHIDKVKNYNPELTRIFLDVMVDNTFDHWNNRMFISSFLFNTFTHNRDRFNWDDINAFYPDAYKLLNKNFIPDHISGSERAGVGLNKHYSISLKLKNTRHNVYANFSLNPNDMANVVRVKHFGDTLQRILKKSNFLFKYLQTRPEAKLVFSPTMVAESGRNTYKSIKKIWPEFADYNDKDIQIVEVKGNRDLESTWILLPDNTLLLCRYRIPVNKTNDPVPPSFMGLDEKIVQLHNRNSYSVCLHLDASGKLIKDYGDKLDIYFWN